MDLPDQYLCTLGASRLTTAAIAGHGPPIKALTGKQQVLDVATGTGDPPLATARRGPGRTSTS
jgi:hypothetical protein